MRADNISGGGRPGRRRVIAAGLAAGLLLTGAAACGGDDDEGGSGGATGADGGGALKGKSLTVAGIWTGAEGKKFQSVLDEFGKRTGAKAKLTPTGDNVAAYLGSKVSGGAPPDVALLPQQGVLVEFAKKGWIKPLPAAAESTLKQNYSSIWQELGSSDGKTYGVYFKVANKSTVWYRTQTFADAGITAPPKSWDELVKTAGTLSDSGTVPLSIGGGDGWTLTDWFENVYMSVAGPDKYDQLSKHEIKWTDPTVKESLGKLAELWGKANYISGGASGALQNDFPKSVAEVFGKDPKAAMVYEGDFVATEIVKAGKKLGTDGNFFPFPAVGAKPPVVGGGDVAVVMKDSPAAQELIKFLATPEAAAVWARQGGFTSPNKSLDLAAYPDDIQRQIAKAVIDAGNDFRFDMSDLAPAAFGGTKGAGEWKVLQDFLAKPTDIDGTAAKLEKEAAAAFKG